MSNECLSDAKFAAPIVRDESSTGDLTPRRVCRTKTEYRRTNHIDLLPNHLDFVHQLTHNRRIVSPMAKQANDATLRHHSCCERRFMPH